MGEVAVSSEEVAAGMEVEIGKEKDWKKKKKKKDEEEGEDNNTEGEEGSSSEVVRWEKFLPRMVLTVLLVEADDSTRQIIAALLRKCSYRVAAVPDGLMAWETLKGKPHNIDLILTEVELPSISGYALLTLVMEHEICKNIPVIMMSSQDSISMVLKCMVKGAADFLIKPVRRNELRNLWQHVWRRQSPNAGNIPQNSPMIPRKVEATSENNAASNHSSGFAMSFTRTKECSQKESDAQGISQLKCVSSSNMSSVESQKYKGCSEIDKRSITPDGISGERSNKLATSYNDAYDATALKQGGKSPCMKALQDQNATLESDRANTNVHHNHIDDVVEPFNGAIGLIGAFDSSEKHMSGNYCLNDGPNRLEFTPQLELSLRRCYRTCLQNQGGEERQALNHSNASAFSRYNSKTLQPFFSTSSNSCLDIKDDTAKSPKLSSDQLSENKNGACQQHAVTSSHNQEILSTLVIAQSDQGDLAYPSPQIGLISVPGVRLDNFSTGYGHVLPPLYYAQASLAPLWSPKVPSKRENSPFPTSTSIHSNPENINAKENCKFSDETTNDSVDINRHQQDNLEPAEEQHVSPATDWSTSSSLCNGFGDHKSSHVYGSLCSTNDGNATLAVAAEKCATPESLNDGGLFIRGVGVTDTQRMSQREAALTKFLLKRKERCFEKKVRYQSRKRLAEQRPRVKGQFVRQTPVTDANA